MDFLDKLAIMLSGSSKKAPKRESEPDSRNVNQETFNIENVRVAEQFDTLNSKENIIEKKITKEEIDNEQVIDLNDILNYKRKSFGDTLIQNDNTQSYNDKYSYLTLEYRNEYNGKDKKLLDKVMPFLDTNTDIGIWVYKNRYGVITTLTIYILVVCFMVFGKISIKETDFSNSIHINVPVDVLEDKKEEEKIVEKKPEKKQKVENYDNQPVENVMVDKNMELDTQLKDDRQTETSDLYREALETQKQLESNRKAYESGLDEVSKITIDKEKHRVADRRQKPTNKNINKLGNVTVSYDLKNRFVIEPEIPAYRCKGAGKVEVEIVVGQNGKVRDASIRSLQGVDDECLPQMALEAARMVIFNADYDAPQKQTGLITFIFVAQ